MIPREALINPNRSVYLVTNSNDHLDLNNAKANDVMKRRNEVSDERFSSKD